MVSESGAWKLKLKATRFLDAEQGTKINLNIALNDVSVDVQIAVNNVNDVRPDYTEDTYRGNDFTDHFTLYEDAKIGTVILNLRSLKMSEGKGFMLPLRIQVASVPEAINLYCLKIYGLMRRRQRTDIRAD